MKKKYTIRYTTGLNDCVHTEVMEGYLLTHDRVHYVYSEKTWNKLGPAALDAMQESLLGVFPANSTVIITSSIQD